MKQSRELPRITVKYQDLANSLFQQVMRKLMTADVDAVNACRIRKVTAVMRTELKKMQELYMEEVLVPYQKRILTETGLNVKDPEATKKATPEQEKLLAEMDKDLEKSQEEFGAREIEVECLPLAPQQLAGIRMSAQEVDALGPFFDEEGKIRTDYFQKKLGVVGDGTQSA